MKILVKLLIAGLILGGGGYFAYTKMQPKNEISYITEPVKRGKIAQTVSATGELSASQLVDVGAQASGQIRKMYVKIGDVVKQGDLIAQIDNRNQTNELETNQARLETYRAQLASAEIALRAAERKRARYQALQAEDAISKEELENAEDGFASAQAKIKEIQSAIKQTQIAINTSETDLGYTRIVAPIDGTVVSLVVEEGQTINANQTTPTVVQIANLSNMLNKMQIAEGDATKVKAGQNISFTILSEPDTPFTGVLDSVDPGLTTMSQGNYSKSTDATSNAVYYYARATIPNESGKLAIGMTTQNTIEIASADNVLTVPTVAIKSRENKKFVRVLGDNNQPIEKEIQTGLRDSMNTEVQSGLAEGDKLIMSEMGADEKSKAMRKGMGGPGGMPR